MDTVANTVPENIPEWLIKADKFRLTLPEEAEYPWLTFLLDCYAMIDSSVEEALNEEKKKNIFSACSEGCSSCCSQPVPITPLEAMGIRIGINTLLPKAERLRIHEQLKEQLGNTHWKNGQCPFLIDQRCSIYALRPIPCRRFVVLNNPCTYALENLFETRPDDLLKPDRAAFYAALAHTSPVYASLGLAVRGEKMSFDDFKNLFVDLRAVNWQK